MKYIYISIFFILNLFISNNVIADQSVIKELQKGGKIIFIRHSLAPGNGDPDNICLLYTSPSPRDKRQSRMPSSA